jgi:plasmid stability protein
VPGLVIKDLPEKLHRQLKDRASRHHRSMTKEVLVMLEQALATDTGLSPVHVPFKGSFALTDDFIDRARREGRE